MIADHDEATMNLSVLMRATPAEIDRMYYLDSIAWFSCYRDFDHAEKRFDAALHGKELK